MTRMFDRAVAHMEKAPSRVYTLNELRKAADVAIRSQYRLSQQLLASGMIERAPGGYKFHDYLIATAAARS